jgi:hypothetical protein
MYWISFDYNVILRIRLISCTWGEPSFPELLKNLFKVIIKFWNFSPLRSTPPATGCSNPGTAPNAGNIVLNLQRKYCQGPPANRWRTLIRLKILYNISIIGSGAEIAASSRRGSTSKGTEVSDLYKYFKYIFFNNSENFLVPPHTSSKVIWN